MNFSGIVAALLGVAFVVLKLAGVIAWSWVWVLSPFWIPLALSTLLILIALVLWRIVWRQDGRLYRQALLETVLLRVDENLRHVRQPEKSVAEFYSAERWGRP